MFIDTNKTTKSWFCEIKKETAIIEPICIYTKTTGWLETKKWEKKGVVRWTYPRCN